MTELEEKINRIEKIVEEMYIKQHTALYYGSGTESLWNRIDAPFDEVALLNTWKEIIEDKK